MPLWHRNGDITWNKHAIFMKDQEQNKLLPIELELEKKYPYFKKMDIYTTVSEAFKKVRQLVRKFSEREWEEVKKLADRDLQLS
ncbi:MAG TPA: hypothetical protein VKR53_03260 [Puia sp.]|nr:hypothetical protein [Puia sp.]